jgi:hypothetical protein
VGKWQWFAVGTDLQGQIDATTEYHLSNDQIITSGFGTVLLSPFFVKKPRRSAAMPTFFASTVLKISSSKPKTYFLLVPNLKFSHQKVCTFAADVFTLHPDMQLNGVFMQFVNFILPLITFLKNIA